MVLGQSPHSLNIEGRKMKQRQIRARRINVDMSLYHAYVGSYLFTKHRDMWEGSKSNVDITLVLCWKKPTISGSKTQSLKYQFQTFSTNVRFGQRNLSFYV